MRLWTKQTDGTYVCLPEGGPDKLVVRPHGDSFVAEVKIDPCIDFDIEVLFSAPEGAMDAAEKEWDTICKRADDPQTAQSALDALMGSMAGKL